MSKVKFGLKNVHIAKITYGESNGVPTITYGTPFALPGAVSLTLDPEGDSADFFADNTKYFSSSANNGYSGSLEMAKLTEEFRTEILGETTDTNGALVESKDDTLSDFALGFEVDGDDKNTRYWFYAITPQRAGAGSSTIETTKEPITETINISANARITDGKVRIFMEETTTNTTAFNGFFTNVYEAQ